MRKIVIAAFIFASLSGFAQVQIDKSISLTSSTPADAKISGIKSVTGAQDAVNAETHQSGSLITATSVSGTDAISLAFTPAITALPTGAMFTFKAAGANTTTSVTIDVDGAGSLTARQLRKNISDNLAAGDIQANQMVSVIYDGTNFQLLGSRVVAGNSNYIQNNAVNATFGTGQAASFDITGNAEINGTLNVNGNVGIGATNPFNKLDIAGNLGMRDNDIYFRAPGNLDVNHGVGFYGGSKLFNGQNINGPVLYGCAGGALGTSSCITNNIALYWNSAGNVGIGNNVAPIQTLDVNGRINVANGVIQRGTTAITTTTDLGLYSGIDGNWIRFVTANSDFAWFTDGGSGTTNRMRLDRLGALTVYGLAGTGNRLASVNSAGTLITPPANSAAGILYGSFYMGDFGGSCGNSSLGSYTGIISSVTCNTAASSDASFTVNLNQSVASYIPIITCVSNSPGAVNNTGSQWNADNDQIWSVGNIGSGSFNLFMREVSGNTQTMRIEVTLIVKSF